MSPPLDPTNQLEGMSIGDLSKFTGMEVARLRMWEKRYGRPYAERRPSGHRRYSHKELQFMLLISEALEKGFRIGQIIKMADPDLARLIREDNSYPNMSDIEEASEHTSFPDMTLWLESVMAFRCRQLFDLLKKSNRDLGCVQMMQTRIKPFMEHIGHLWEKGLLHVGHEHFASNCIQDYLKELWRQNNHDKMRPQVLAAMLPGDDHSLGLNMACATLTEAGYRVLYLGHRAPVNAILATLKSSQAIGIAISVPRTTNWETTKSWLEEIRDRLKKDVFISVGGAGIKEEIASINNYRELHSFHDWLVAKRHSIP